MESMKYWCGTCQSITHTHMWIYRADIHNLQGNSLCSFSICCSCGVANLQWKTHKACVHCAPLSGLPSYSQPRSEMILPVSTVPPPSDVGRPLSSPLPLRSRISVPFLRSTNKIQSCTCSMTPQNWANGLSALDSNINVKSLPPSLAFLYCNSSFIVWFCNFLSPCESVTMQFWHFLPGSIHAWQLWKFCWGGKGWIWHPYWVQGCAQILWGENNSERCELQGGDWQYSCALSCFCGLYFIFNGITIKFVSFLSLCGHMSLFDFAGYCMVTSQKIFESCLWKGIALYWPFVNFQIRHGEAVGIIGPSGTGKSTILKIIAGLLAPDKVIYLTLFIVKPWLNFYIGTPLASLNCLFRCSISYCCSSLYFISCWAGWGSYLR